VPAFTDEFCSASVFFLLAADTSFRKEVGVNLEQLRKQAKELVAAARDGDPGALDRLANLPVRLASAQLVIAREHGFSSWPALVHRFEASVESFVVAATSGQCERARRLLEARPEIAGDAWARLVLGRGWDGGANEVGGPRRWPPLHYVCHSCFASVRLARMLLEGGADPNACFPNEYGPMSALFGAAGVLHDPELTAVLLEHGADPNGEPQFGDALYHSVEAADTACLRLLLDHGAEPKGSSALAHALDYERLEHVRLLLGAGSDVDGGDIVHAVRRGRGVEYIRLLAAQGVDLDQRGGEWSTPPEQHRTAYQNAVIRARDDIAQLLAELGASTDLRPGDREVEALARGKRPHHPLPEQLDHDQQEVVGLAALDGHLELVVELLGPSFFAHIGGGPPGTLLHHACWVGNPQIVRRLVELGADPNARSGAQYDTPLAWAMLGSQYHGLAGRDYVAVAEQLVAAGAELAPRFAEVAQGPLADWLEDEPASGS
jgi:ankyrin repeat protein